MGKFVSRSSVRNVDWQIWQEDNGRFQPDAVTRAILLDIREELKRLNALLYCSNFQDIPKKLDRIEKNTKKRRKRKVIAKGKPKLRLVSR